ncbi:MAG: hypothetical protein MAG794_00236 [Gammaproteobacteria bacterium]|nr:hypothetical protein [Gammaproteobacteria bacterium]
MTQPAELMTENLEAAHRVGERLIRARRRLDDVLPLGSESSVDQLDEDTMAWIDAYLKRWENLQDMLEGQVVRGLVILEGETERIQTRRDRAHFLEKLELVDAAEQWFDAGELRNQLVHSYPLSNPKQIQRVNAATEACDFLIETFNRLLTHVKDNNLVPVSVNLLITTND